MASRELDLCPICVYLHCMQCKRRLALYANGSHCGIVLPGICDGSCGGRKLIVVSRPFLLNGGAPVAVILHILQVTFIVWQ